MIKNTFFRNYLLAMVAVFLFLSAIVSLWMEEVVKSVGIVEAYHISAEEFGQMVVVTAEPSGWVTVFRIISGTIATLIFVFLYREQKRAR